MKIKTNFQKMLASIGLLSTTVPTTLNVVACGPNIVKREPKLALNKVINKKWIDGNVANEENTVLAVVKDLNSSLVVTDVTVRNFEPATKIKNGSFTVVAKPHTRYVGEVGITISSLAKINLNTVIKNREVDGNKFNDANAVLNRIIDLTADLTTDDVTTANFKKATEVDEGFGEIVAKPNTKYTGKVTIKINKLAKIQLETVIKAEDRTIDGNKFNDANAVLNRIIDLTADLTTDDVTTANFKKATEVDEGFGEIVAKPNTKYTGKVTIKILKLKESVTEAQIVGAINSTIYEKTVMVTMRVHELKAAMTPAFIKEKLPENIKEAFQNGLFKVKEVTEEFDVELTDENFQVIKKHDLRIHYTYGSFNGKARIFVPTTQIDLSQVDASNFIMGISLGFYDKKIDLVYREIYSKIGSMWDNDFHRLINTVAQESHYNIIKQTGGYTLDLYIDKNLQTKATDNDIENDKILYLNLQGSKNKWRDFPPRLIGSVVLAIKLNVIGN